MKTFDCGGCGGVFPSHGERTAHCGACHCTFAGMEAFDRHRAGMVCNDPATQRVKPSRLWALDAEGIWHYDRAKVGVAGVGDTNTPTPDDYTRAA